MLSLSLYGAVGNNALGIFAAYGYLCAVFDVVGLACGACRLAKADYRSFRSGSGFGTIGNDQFFNLYRTCYIFVGVDTEIAFPRFGGPGGD